MGSVIKRGNSWRVMWRDHEGRQRSRSFDRKVDARAYLSEIEADLVRGAYVDPRAGTITLARYVTERWLPAQNWRPSTRQLAESHLRTHLLPALGDRPLARITRTDVQGLVSQLGRTLAPTTVEAIYRRLVSILEAAVLDRVIATSPAVKIQLPKQHRRAADAVVVLDLDDVHRLADTVPEGLRAFVWTMAAAGLRPGEAAGLTTERVDFLRREIIVDRQLVTVVGERPSLALPKTPASVRTIPIPDALVTELARHLEHHSTTQVPDLEGAPAHLLFTNRDGRPLRRNVLGDAWDRAARRAELPPAARGWHVLRHVYASLLIHGGLSVRAVQARLGHASATETLDTYAHLWPDSDDDTRRAVERALRANDLRPAESENPV